MMPYDGTFSAICVCSDYKNKMYIDNRVSNIEKTLLSIFTIVQVRTVVVGMKRYVGKTSSCQSNWIIIPTTVLRIQHT